MGSATRTARAASDRDDEAQRAQRRERAKELMLTVFGSATLTGAPKGMRATQRSMVRQHVAPGHLGDTRAPHTRTHAHEQKLGMQRERRDVRGATGSCHAIQHLADVMDCNWGRHCIVR